MRHIKKIGTLTLMLLFGLTFANQSTFKTSANSSTNDIIIKGLVSNPLNLTYSELETFPMIWEIVSMQCVYASYGQPYNWTGIPLFYLLNLAKVQNGAKEVVFRAEDGFSSSITIDRAMHPTTILALKMDGITLPYANGYPYRVVVPCKYGYKWVGWIDEIEVVDYDYKGTYESKGFSDEADIPNCNILPETTPAYTALNATWREAYMLTVFSNATILDASFNQTTKHIYLNFSSNGNSENFVYVIVPKQLLTSNFTIFSDNILIQHFIIQSQTNSFIYFTLNQGMRIVKIKGMLLADITGSMGMPDGKVDIMDIAFICMHYGSSVGSEKYVLKADINRDEKIDMIDVYMAVKDFGKIMS